LKAEQTALAAPDVVLVRYGELALKKGNRVVFERALMRNIKQAVLPLSPVTIERHYGRILVVPERRTNRVAERVAEVFGIKTVSPAWRVAKDPEAMLPVAQRLLDEALEQHAGSSPITFRVRVKRSDKRFPIRSSDFERWLADRILPGPERVRVKLDNPELTLGVEIRDEGCYLFLRRIAGPGGLPVGTLGRGLCLLSGGIDSPVAAWMTMKRGCHMGYLSFHSKPYIGEGLVKKVTDLVRALCRWQATSQLYVAPFAEVQTTIRDTAPESYRTVLYRRMMQRIGTRLSLAQGYQALVTGECLGQVASQTLENLTLIGAASDLPVLRLLLTYDKEEVIAVARRIGTFDLSIVPEPDCCTVFQPRRPVIRGKLEACLAAEARMDVDGLVQRALDGIEVRTIEHAE